MVTDDFHSGTPSIPGIVNTANANSLQGAPMSQPSHSFSPFAMSSNVPPQAAQSSKPASVCVLSTPEQYKLVSKALPQPHFDGRPETWEDFKRKFRMWFKLTQLGQEFEGIILVNLLPEKDGAMFLLGVIR